MHVELVVVGWLTAPAAMWRRGDTRGGTIRVPVPVFVIDVGRERILVDTGVHPAAFEDPKARYGSDELVGRFHPEPAGALEEQIDLSSITRVVLSHLHFDHAGGLDLVAPETPVVMQRREWCAAHDETAVARNGYLRRDYAGERELLLVDGDHDLLGDGSVQLLLTPGHTPGHQSVMVGGRVVMGVDVTYFASGLDDHVFPVYGDDQDAQARSAERLRALRDRGVRVLPGHDPAVIVPGTVPAGDA